MTHAPLLLLFLYSVFLLVPPHCHLCSYELNASLSSLRNTETSFFIGFDVSSADNLCNCKAAMQFQFCQTLN